MWNTLGKFMEGLLFGAALGYVAGLLSAPKSGNEMRRELADGSEDLYKQASSSLSDIRQKTGLALQDIQARGGDALKKVQEKKEQFANKFDEMSEQATQVLTEDGGSVPTV
jgi:gas vesicle protein